MHVSQHVQAPQVGAGRRSGGGGGVGGESVVGPCRYCSPRHPSLVEPSLLELHDIPCSSSSSFSSSSSSSYDLVSIICQVLVKGWGVDSGVSESVEG
jgi:hypothetical protein